MEIQLDLISQYTGHRTNTYLYPHGRLVKWAIGTGSQWIRTGIASCVNEISFYSQYNDYNDIYGSGPNYRGAQV